MSLARIALAAAVIAAILLLVAGPGTRLGLWDFRIGLGLMRWAVMAGLAASVLAVVLLLVPSVRSGNGVLLAIALLLGLGVAFVPWNMMRQARQVPPIHDISTDTARPPEFVEILPLRADAANPATYGGEEVAREQAQAYPQIRPYVTDDAPGPAFDRALQAARAMGWQIVASEPAAGRIEATDTTRWFGFKDDVVIRVEPEGEGARIDVRSVSRVGKSDLGTNARRVAAYLQSLGG